jgi:hypothetical protein
LFSWNVDDAQVGFSRKQNLRQGFIEERFFGETHREEVKEDREKVKESSKEVSAGSSCL